MWHKVKFYVIGGLIFSVGILGFWYYRKRLEGSKSEKKNPEFNFSN
jgi:hypothetical protein